MRRFEAEPKRNPGLPLRPLSGGGLTEPVPPNVAPAGWLARLKAGERMWPMIGAEFV
jgi:hypothetical protein